MPFRLPRLFTGRALRNRPSRGGEPATAGGRVGFADDEWDDRMDLLPRAIIRQVLFDPIELPPAWLRRRPADLALAAAAAGAGAGAGAAAVAPPPAASKPAKRDRSRNADDAPTSRARSSRSTPTSNAAKPSSAKSSGTRARRQARPTEPPAAD